jgi:hypothetical protein
MPRAGPSEAPRRPQPIRGLRLLTRCLALLALACAPESRLPSRDPGQNANTPAVRTAGPPAPEADPTSGAWLVVDAGAPRGPLSAAFLPSAMLAFADQEALAAFGALPGRYGTVRMGPRLDLTRDLDEYRAQLRQSGPLIRELERRGARVVLGIAKTPSWLSDRIEGVRMEGSGWTEREASPPRDLAELEQLAYETVRILSEEFGASPFYEFWNEPNAPAFWLGTQQELFRAYAAFALGARRADPQAKVGGLAFGGVAATRVGAGFSPHVPLFYSFLHFVAHPPEDVNGGARLPLDFVSWHCFNTAPWEQWGESAQTVREWLSQIGFAAELPQLVTEWALWTTFPDSLDPGRDGAQGAAYLVASLHEIAAARIAGHSIAALQDFTQSPAGELLQGGFGLISRDPDVRKSSFAALELLSQLASHEVRSELAPQAVGAGVGVLASAERDRCAILLHRYPVPPLLAMSAVARAAGFERAEQFGAPLAQIEAFLRRESALPANLSPEARSALEGVRIAGETSVRDPELARVSLQVNGCPRGSHSLYRIGSESGNPTAAYRRARSQGLAHDEALARALAAEGAELSRGPGIPEAVELERHSVALVVLEP